MRCWRSWATGPTPRPRRKRSSPEKWGGLAAETRAVRSVEISTDFALSVMQKIAIGVNNDRDRASFRDRLTSQYADGLISSPRMGRYELP